jgi:hypothetical protein
MTGRDVLRGVRRGCSAAFNHKDTKVTKDRHEGRDWIARYSFESFVGFVVD